MYQVLPFNDMKCAFQIFMAGDKKLFVGSI